MINIGNVLRVRTSVLKRRVVYTVVFIALFLYITSNEDSWFAFFNDTPPPKRLDVHHRKGKVSQDSSSQQFMIRQRGKGDWQTVVKDQIWIYSAFLDRREGPVIKIFGIVRRDLMGRLIFKCIMKDVGNDQLKPEISTSTDIHDLDSQYQDTR